MNKSADSHAIPLEVKDKHEMHLYLGPCFDLTLSASEAIQIFDDRRKTGADQGRVATDLSLSKRSVPKRPRCEN
jgi:lipopolysaccharide assembly outer membrane protein LptD (OstA)